MVVNSEFGLNKEPRAERRVSICLCDLNYSCRSRVIMGVKNCKRETHVYEGFRPWQEFIFVEIFVIKF